MSTTEKTWAAQKTTVYIPGSNHEWVSTTNSTLIGLPENLERDEARAQRIAAAVNACAGIPIEALKAGVVKQMIQALDKALPLLHASYLDHEGTPNGDAVFEGLEAVRDVVALLQAPAQKLRNYYQCEPDCGYTWDSTWDCECNERCPKCGREIVPYKSELIQ